MIEIHPVFKYKNGMTYIPISHSADMSNTIFSIKAIDVFGSLDKEKVVINEITVKDNKDIIELDANNYGFVIGRLLSIINKDAKKLEKKLETRKTAMTSLMLIVHLVSEESEDDDNEDISLQSEMQRKIGKTIGNYASEEAIVNQINESLSEAIEKLYQQYNEDFQIALFKSDNEDLIEEIKQKTKAIVFESMEEEDFYIVEELSNDMIQNKIEEFLNATEE